MRCSSVWLVMIWGKMVRQNNLLTKIKGLLNFQDVFGINQNQTGRKMLTK